MSFFLFLRDLTQQIKQMKLRMMQEITNTTTIIEMAATAPVLRPEAASMVVRTKI